MSKEERKETDNAPRSKNYKFLIPIRYNQPERRKEKGGKKEERDCFRV